MMMNKRRVVITGLGVLAPGAIGKDSFWELLSQGRSGIGPISLYNMDHFRLQAGGEVKDFEPKKFIENRKALKMMARDIQLAVAAANLVMEDSKLAEQKPDPTRFGVSLGAGLINTSIQELSFAIRESINEKGKFDIQKYGREGMNALTPLWMLKYLPNMLSCHSSIIYDAQGPSNTVTTGCAASTQAIGEAFRIIERGSADVMLAGGAESKLDPLNWARFEMLGLLTKNGKSPEKIVRPFDRDRDGFVLGEAGAMLILEEFDHAKKRGAPIYGEMRGYGSTANASPLLNKKVDHRSQQNAIEKALSDAGEKSLSYIQAHGLGTRDGDLLETKAIKGCFGEAGTRIPVSSTKGATGYIGAASGALGVITALLAMKNSQIPPTLNFENPDPECDLDVVSNTARTCQIETVLINTFGLGGQNASLVVKKI